MAPQRGSNTARDDIGKPARVAAPALTAALDPFLGTAAAAGGALIAIGPEILPIVEARLAAVPANDHTRPVLAAVAATLRDPDRRDQLTPALEAISYGNDRSGRNDGNESRRASEDSGMTGAIRSCEVVLDLRSTTMASSSAWGCVLLFTM